MKQLVLFCLVIVCVVQVNSFILFKLVSLGGRGNSISTATTRPSSSSTSSGVQYDFSGLSRNIVRRKVELGNNLLNAITQYKTGLLLEGVRILVSATSPAPPNSSTDDEQTTNTPRPVFSYSKTVGAGK